VKFQGQLPAGSASSDSTRRPFSFRQCAEECRMLAKRVDLPDRDILLKMAESWDAIIRRLQKNIRLAKRIP